ncbi:MAG TPA: hypothetical protein VFY83_05740, partial [Anaerolineales bacterium]|nr:hypothetical protein [Anaerolineales bacterium]
VRGLAISPPTIVYYYIYGSVQAALSRKSDNRCDKARKAFDEVRTELETNPDDYEDGRDIILQIIEDGEFICRSLEEGDEITGTSVPTQVETQVSEEMSDSEGTPTP